MASFTERLFARETRDPKAAGSRSGSFPSNFRSLVNSNSELVQRLKQVGKLEGHTGAINTVSWSHTGDQLVTGSDDCKIKIWDVAKGQPLLSIDSGHTANIYCTKFIPETNNSQVVSGGGDRQVRVTDLNRMAVKPFYSHGGRVRSLATISCHTFLSASEDGTVRQFDVRERPPAAGTADEHFDNRSILVDQKVERHGRAYGTARVAINTLAVEPLRPYLFATGGADPIVRVFDRRYIKMSSSHGSGARFSRRPPWMYCCVPSHLKHPASRNANLGMGHPGRVRQITGLTFTHGGGEVVASYNRENIYAFSTTAHARDYDSVFSREPDTPRWLSGGWNSRTPRRAALDEPPTLRDSVVSMLEQRADEVVATETTEMPSGSPLRPQAAVAIRGADEPGMSRSPRAANEAGTSGLESDAGQPTEGNAATPAGEAADARTQRSGFSIFSGIFSRRQPWHSMTAGARSTGSQGSLAAGSARDERDPEGVVAPSNQIVMADASTAAARHRAQSGSGGLSDDQEVPWRYGATETALAASAPVLDSASLMDPSRLELLHREVMQQQQALRQHLEERHSFEQSSRATIDELQGRVRELRRQVQELFSAGETSASFTHQIQESIESLELQLNRMQREGPDRDGEDSGHGIGLPWHHPMRHRHRLRGMQHLRRPPPDGTDPSLDELEAAQPSTVVPVPSGNTSHLHPLEMDVDNSSAPSELSTPSTLPRHHSYLSRQRRRAMSPDPGLAQGSKAGDNTSVEAAASANMEAAGNNNEPCTPADAAPTARESTRPLKRLRTTEEVAARAALSRRGRSHHDDQPVSAPADASTSSSLVPHSAADLHVTRAASPRDTGGASPMHEVAEMRPALVPLPFLWPGMEQAAMEGLRDPAPRASLGDAEAFEALASPVPRARTPHPATRTAMVYGSGAGLLISFGGNPQFGHGMTSSPAHSGRETDAGEEPQDSLQGGEVVSDTDTDLPALIEDDPDDSSGLEGAIGRRSTAQSDGAAGQTEQGAAESGPADAWPIMRARMGSVVIDTDTLLEPDEAGEAGMFLHCYTGHSNWMVVKDVTTMGPRDNFVVSGSDDGHVFVWDFHTAEVVTLLSADEHTVHCATAHPHDMMLATCGLEPVVKLWSPEAEFAQQTVNLSSIMEHNRSEGHGAGPATPPQAFLNFMHFVERAGEGLVNAAARQAVTRTRNADTPNEPPDARGARPRQEERSQGPAAALPNEESEEESPARCSIM